MQTQFPKRGFERNEFVSRVEKAQETISKCQLDAILISTEADIRYFTGFMTQFWQSPTRPWFVIILPEVAPIAVIPSIGIRLMQDCYISEIYSWSSPDEFDDGIGLLLRVIDENLSPGLKRVGLLMGKETSFRAPLADILKLTAPDTKMQISDVTSEIQQIRMKKSEPEIEKLKFVCGIVSQVFEDLPNWLLEKLPLSELFRTFKIKALELGVDDVSYLVGSAGQGGYFDIIAPPTSRFLRSGDIFMLDTGCVWDGYFSDFDRNFALKSASNEAFEAHKKLIDATVTAVDSIVPGKTTSQDLFRVMSEVIYPNIDPSDLKIDNVGRLGHGLGIQLTEPPSHTSWDTTVLQPSMTLTIEPSIFYGKESFLMVAEENILITKVGVEYLSKPCNRDLKVIK